MPQILLIEDDQCFADSIKMLVKPAGFRVQWATDAAKGYQLFSQTEDPFDTVIIDYHLPDLKGAELAE
ncbi:response regulator, partial [Pseudomonas sp. GP01-A6]|uniref:response regulator n=1 Tax=Pseudomonas sp. GP01-A6 TaxID=2070569 RepID=UPI001304E4B3